MWHFSIFLGAQANDDLRLIIVPLSIHRHIHSIRILSPLSPKYIMSTQHSISTATILVQDPTVSHLASYLGPTLVLDSTLYRVD